MGLVLAKKLINLYPNDKEGQLDKRLASLINKKVCAKVLEKYDLLKFISISKDNFIARLFFSNFIQKLLMTHLEMSNLESYLLP